MAKNRSRKGKSEAKAPEAEAPAMEEPQTAPTETVTEAGMGDDTPAFYGFNQPTEMVEAVQVDEEAKARGEAAAKLADEAEANAAEAKAVATEAKIAANAVFLAQTTAQKTAEAALKARQNADLIIQAAAIRSSGTHLTVKGVRAKTFYRAGMGFAQEPIVLSMADLTDRQICLLMVPTKYLNVEIGPGLKSDD